MKPLDRIQIKGFKSIHTLDLKLGALNVLIGANGAGKSNFISLFRLLGELSEGRFQRYVASNPDKFLYYGRKVTPQLWIRLDFGKNGYELTLEASVANSLSFIQETLHFHGSYHAPFSAARPLGAGHLETLLPKQLEDGGNKKIAEYIVPALKSWKVYHFHDTSDSAVVKRAGEINDNLYLRPDASNLAAFLYLIQKIKPQTYAVIRDTIRQVAPFFDDFLLRPLPENPDLIQLEWREIASDYPFRAHHLSDGTLRFMCLATLLLQPELPSTILIDEPELGLHPYAINVLASLLRSAAASTQVIISTQSVTLVNQFELEDLIIVDHKDGKSEFSHPNKKHLEDWLAEYSLGELWEKNVLGGRP